MYKIIDDYPNYRINESGDVQSRYKNKSKSISDAWYSLKPVLDTNNGYVLVTLINHNGRRNMSIHRLVAAAFLPNPENKPQVNHIDGVKTNNHYSNLEWSTAQENSQHSYDTGLSNTLSTNVAVVRYTKDGSTCIDEYASMHEAERMLKIPYQNIGKVCRGLRKTAGGYYWEYKKFRD